MKGEEKGYGRSPRKHSKKGYDYYTDQIFCCLLHSLISFSKFGHPPLPGILRESSLKMEISLKNILCWVLCLVTQSCLSFGDPMDCSPPDSSAHGILQARIMEWVAIPFSRGSSPPRNQTCVSCIAGRFSEPPGKPLRRIQTLSKRKGLNML